MRFSAIGATAHPAGNRIDLAWSLPETPAFPGVRVVRREGTHPVDPEDGVLVAEGTGITSATDQGLRGETVYYYALFGYRGSPREYDLERSNRAAAMATSPNGHADQMYALLPALYRRYDSRLPAEIPPGMEPADKLRGQLRRFLELPGAQLDLLKSFASATRDLYAIDRTRGDLLPLLAAWIGWNTDYRLEVDAQRNEVRNAPFLYRTIGLKPTIETTVKRLSNWESRTKEFVHNVARSNTPERYNLWVQENAGAGWGRPELLSLDYAFDGRPVAVREAGGRLWLFYHALANGRWEIRAKCHDAIGGWGPSAPLPQAARSDNRQPAAVLVNGEPWLFWIERPASAAARLVCARRAGDNWSSPQPLPFGGEEPREPWACVDQAQGVWLFWTERINVRRQLRYARYNGIAWEGPLAFPRDAGADPRVEAEPFVLLDAAAQRIWALWSRERVIGPGQTRREIAWRVKGNLQFDTSGWGAVATLPREVANDYHDREPTARLDPNGRPEVFFSSSQGTQGHGIWRRVLMNAGTNAWSAAEKITDNPYSQRAPLVIADGGDLRLFHRANDSVNYASAIYSATVSTDFRYAGTTTADTRNGAKLALRGAFEDFATYTCDAGQSGKRTDDDWYARDTVGVYLAPDTLDPARLATGIGRLRGVIGEFMPMTDRAVFIAGAGVETDRFYGYGLPPAEGAQLIAESYSDLVTAVSDEQALSEGEDFADVLG